MSELYITNLPHIPDTYGEHVKDAPALHPSQQHDQADDAEGVEGQLLPQGVHALLQGSLGGLAATTSCVKTGFTCLYIPLFLVPHPSLITSAWIFTQCLIWTELNSTDLNEYIHL